ncbi:MAG TPA: creatininase family protein, partial [Solirubrobacter sp.]|nr:creatininase family protein [Solirubrobacter sp.]
MASTAASELEALPSAAVTGGLLVVPLGATEQHGPHLPLGTDTIIARALAGAVPGAVVAPALPYGSSGEHAG